VEFGHVYEGLTDIDFSLPADTAVTKRTLDDHQSDEKLSVFVGASKWGGEKLAR